MKVLLNDIQNAKEIITKLANVDLPIKESYLLSKLIKLLNEEYNTIEEFRMNLVRKYGETDGDNIKVIPGTENFISFMNEYNQFMNTEIDLNLSKIDLNVEQLNFSMKPIDLIAIEKFINIVGLQEDLAENISE